MTAPIRGRPEGPAVARPAPEHLIWVANRIQHRTADSAHIGGPARVSAAQCVRLAGSQALWWPAAGGGLLFGLRCRAAAVSAGLGSGAADLHAAPAAGAGGWAVV